MYGLCVQVGVLCVYRYYFVYTHRVWLLEGGDGERRRRGAEELLFHSPGNGLLLEKRIRVNSTLTSVKY